MARLAVPADADGIAGVHIASWQAAYRGVFPDAFLDSLDAEIRSRWWRQQIEEGARVLVTDVDRRIAGFCLVGDSDDQGWGEIYAIYVDSAHWSDGLGYELFRNAGEVLVDMGHVRALLWVLQSNTRARDFYERQGMKLGKPIRIEEIGGVQVTEVRYELDLREPV